jgi:hypothetical protein
MEGGGALLPARNQTLTETFCPHENGVALRSMTRFVGRGFLVRPKQRASVLFVSSGSKISS